MLRSLILTICLCVFCSQSANSVESFFDALGEVPDGDGELVRCMHLTEITSFINVSCISVKSVQLRCYVKPFGNSTEHVATKCTAGFVCASAVNSDDIDLYIEVSTNNYCYFTIPYNRTAYHQIRSGANNWPVAATRARAMY